MGTGQPCEPPWEHCEKLSLIVVESPAGRWITTIVTVETVSAASHGGQQPRGVLQPVSLSARPFGRGRSADARAYLQAPYRFEDSQGADRQNPEQCPIGSNERCLMWPVLGLHPFTQHVLSNRPRRRSKRNLIASRVLRNDVRSASCASRPKLPCCTFCKCSLTRVASQLSR